MVTRFNALLALSAVFCAPLAFPVAALARPSSNTVAPGGTITLIAPQQGADSYSGVPDFAVLDSTGNTIDTGWFGTVGANGWRVSVSNGVISENATQADVTITAPANAVANAGCRVLVYRSRWEAMGPPGSMAPARFVATPYLSAAL